jgi:hypothetical protein
MSLLDTELSSLLFSRGFIPPLSDQLDGLPVRFILRVEARFATVGESIYVVGTFADFFQEIAVRDEV